MNNVKSINGLMKHLRVNHNMQIKGNNDKKMLENIGYYHGYKGYRYIKNPNNKLEFQNFNELIEIINFDNKIKCLLYPYVMYIETALKNRVLKIIIEEGKTYDFSKIYSNLMNDYKYYKENIDKKVCKNVYKNLYRKRLETYNRIQNTIANQYISGNSIVSHYLEKDESVPIWAIFEIITLGEFGNLVSTLNINIRKKISQNIGLNIAFDSSGNLSQNIIFTIKDLRNAIAHNNVVFDARFKERNISKNLCNIIEYETNIKNISFNNITDYIILVSYIVRKLNNNNEDLKIIDNYLEIISKLENQIPRSMYDKIIFTSDKQKINIFKTYCISC